MVIFLDHAATDKCASFQLESLSSPSPQIYLYWRHTSEPFFFFFIVDRRQIDRIMIKTSGILIFLEPTTLFTSYEYCLFVRIQYTVLSNTVHRPQISYRWFTLVRR